MLLIKAGEKNMSNYIYTNEGLVNADELMHYGVPGMKWGRRKNSYVKRAVRGHAGPGRYMTTKRQLAGDKRDLEALNKGQHLSVGLTKKRQAAYDAKDRARLEKRIAKNEKRLADHNVSKDSAVTRRVKEDYRKMSDQDFKTKYKVSKDKYAKRVEKYGDPYMKAPLAKLGKKLAQKEDKKYISKLKKSLTKDANNDLNKPYSQPIGNGAYANWPTKRAFIDAEINRVKRNSI